MASNIVTTNIDENYPVAGQDNDSQGFRDNFQNIKTAIEVAKGELTGLQNTSPQLTNNNDFNSNTISNAVLQDVSEKAPATINISAQNDTINFEDGSFRRISLTIDGDVDDPANLITFTGFGPADTLSKIRIEARIPDGSPIRYLKFTIPTGKVYERNDVVPALYNSTHKNYKLDNPLYRYIFDVWAYNVNNGIPQELYVDYIGEFKQF
jgi:hypothetical protein